MDISFKDFKQAGKTEIFTVTIADLIEIRGCSYKSGTSAKGPYEFIAMPQRHYLDKEGEKKYVSDINLDRELHAKVLRAYRVSNQQPNEEPPPLEDGDIPF